MFVLWRFFIFSTWSPLPLCPPLSNPSPVPICEARVSPCLFWPLLFPSAIARVSPLLPYGSCDLAVCCLRLWNLWLPPSVWPWLSLVCEHGVSSGSLATAQSLMRVSLPARPAFNPVRSTQCTQNQNYWLSHRQCVDSAVVNNVWFLHEHWVTLASITCNIIVN